MLYASRGHTSRGYYCNFLEFFLGFGTVAGPDVLGFVGEISQTRMGTNHETVHREKVALAIHTDRDDMKSINIHVGATALCYACRGIL